MSMLLCALSQAFVQWNSARHSWLCMPVDHSRSQPDNSHAHSGTLHTQLTEAAAHMARHALMRPITVHTEARGADTRGGAHAPLRPPWRRRGAWRALVNVFQAGAGGRDRTGRDADTDHSAHGGAGGGHSRGRTRTPQAAVAAARRAARILATPFNTHPARAVEHARRAEPLGIVRDVAARRVE